MAGRITSQVDDTKRFNEIVGILRKHQLTQGLTPEKVLAIFEDLGPTYVKFGQILSMRSDILPKEYCKALEDLRTDVTPMPMDMVYDILSAEYGQPWDAVFSRIEPTPLGSASIAQAHEAYLADGRRVVIKVQRPGLYDKMERDVRLLKRAASLLKYTPIGSALDFCAVLEEMWKTAQEEMDFNIEARNIMEFKACNSGVVYADCPAAYMEWCTRNVLVMEYIGGHQVDDAAGLLEDGYDLEEIATKLVYNYIEQITQYRFFHADPHPGNIRVQDGKIVWLDLGMMGRLSKREADLYNAIIQTINDNDALGLTDALLAIARYDHVPDRLEISERIGEFFGKYEAMPMADMDMTELVEEFFQILNRFELVVPSSLTMLGRSLIVIQGMLTGISPDVNILEIVAHYVAQNTISREFVESKIKELAKQLARSGNKLTMLPSQFSEFLRKASAGQIVVNWKKAYSESEYTGQYKLLNRLILALIDCSLIVAAALVCLSNLPRFLGLPWPSTVFLALAVVVTVRLTANGRKMK